MWPFDAIGDSVGNRLNEMAMSVFDAAMHMLWDGGLLVLREAFKLADRFSMFTVDTRTGPVSVLWPMMLWISGVLALGLFFWQLTITSLRGGRGFLRLVTGPLQYGIALAVTVGLTAGFLVASDGLTEGILQAGLQSRNFQEALTHTSFGDETADGVKAVVLGLCAVFGVFPAGIGFVLEMLFREAAIYVLVATIPIAAAGLLAQVTRRWFWMAIRWLLACIALKPVLALALVLGVAIAGGADGLSGILAGVGVLIIALLVPFVLFRLFAFVDPASDTGAAFRDASHDGGVDSYGPNNPAMQAASALGRFYGGSGGDGGGEQESANTDRFDDAEAEFDDSDGDWDDERPGGQPDASSRPNASGGGDSSGGSGGEPEGSGGGSGGSNTPPPPPPDSEGSEQAGEDADGDDGDAGGSRPAANRERVVATEGLGPQLVGGGGDTADDGADSGDTGSPGADPAVPESGEPGNGATGGGQAAVDPAVGGVEDDESPVPSSRGARGGGTSRDNGEPPPPEAPDLTTAGPVEAPAPGGDGAAGGAAGAEAATGAGAVDQPPPQPPAPSSSGGSGAGGVPVEGGGPVDTGPGLPEGGGRLARPKRDDEPRDEDMDPETDEGVIPE